MMRVKADQKSRIRLPKDAREKFKLKDKEVLYMEVTEDEIRIVRPKKIDTSNDLILRDMIERPMRSKIKITSELLEKWEDEMWMP